MSTVTANGAALVPVRVLVKWLCFITVLFASADQWPTITAGFTFRLSQFCVFACMPLLLPILKHDGVRTFPGLSWCTALVIWLIATLPFSLFTDRTVGYTFWVAANVLIIFVFVQVFKTERDVRLLVRMLMYSFIAMAAFGAVQMLAGFRGIDLFVTTWWVPGRVARVNGLSYEPSYYATYMMPGWILAMYLIEKRATAVPRGLQILTALACTGALIICSSRLGWGLVFAWLGIRVGVYIIRFLAGMRIRIGRVYATMALIVILLVPTVAVIIIYLDKILKLLSAISFLLSGLGLFGLSAHSSATRFSEFEMTWNAFMVHPFFGTGLGALPVEIGAQQGVTISTIEEAKHHEGMSIFFELLASVGIAGAALFVGFAVAVIRAHRKVRVVVTPEMGTLIGAVGWSLVWLLLALQFNQNFLRIYLWIDIAIFVCLISVCLREARSRQRFAERENVRLFAAETLPSKA